MSTELVPAQQQRDVYAIMDQMDDDLIKAEIENRITETWVYSFQADGRPQIGLSKVGVDACCTEMAKDGKRVIREGRPQMEIDPTNAEYILFTCPASRFKINKEDGREIQFETVYGVKRQWTRMRLRREGRVVEDPFWYEKGVAKAGRNARSRLIPEDIKIQIFALAKKEKKKERVRVIETPARQSTAEAAPAAAPKEASPAPDTEKITPSQVKELWRIARKFVDHDEEKAQAAVKTLLKFVDSQSKTSIQATGELSPAYFARICHLLETGEIPKEWEGKLEWGDKPAPKPEPAPKDEAPF